MKAVSIPNSPFLHCPYKGSTHSQFTILMLLMRRQSPFSICHPYAASMQAAFILNFQCSNYLDEGSLYSQLAILRLHAWRQSLFSIHYSQSLNMKVVSILNLLDCQHAGSLTLENNQVLSPVLYLQLHQGCSILHSQISLLQCLLPICS